MGTAMDLARRRGHDSVVRLLEQYSLMIACRREWCRVFVMAMSRRHLEGPVNPKKRRRLSASAKATTKDDSATCSLVDFFTTYPGLTKFIGTKLLLYYNTP